VRKPFPGVWGAVLLVLAFALGQAGLAFLFGRFFTDHLVLFVGLVNIVVLGAIAAVGYTLSKEPPAWGRGRPVSKGLFAALPITALGGALALGCFADWLTKIVPLPPALARLLEDLLDGPPAEAVFALVLVAPLTEELLFRGLIFRGLERRYGAMPALLLSSAFFAISHFNIVQALPAFAAGLYLGWLYRSTGTLWWPMAAHALYNGLSLALALAFPDTSSVPDAQPMPWWLGVGGAAVMAAGLWLTKRGVPLKEETPTFSDKSTPLP
jgi:membrane protease YdiL (CAAX protease family)